MANGALSAHALTNALLPVCQLVCTAILPVGAHAVKRVVAGLGPEHAPILGPQTAAPIVWAHHGKTATRTPVQVGHFVSKLSFFLC